MYAIYCFIETSNWQKFKFDKNCIKRPRSAARRSYTCQRVYKKLMNENRVCKKMMKRMIRCTINLTALCVVAHRRRDNFALRWISPAARLCSLGRATLLCRWISRDCNLHPMTKIFGWVACRIACESWTTLR